MKIIIKKNDHRGVIIFKVILLKKQGRGEFSKSMASY
jgi:hypothetical protein